jgi:acetyl-CoA synthetase
VAEAAVVGASDPMTGQGIVAFVTIKSGVPTEGDDGVRLVAQLREVTAEKIGKLARPRQILLTPELPKTRSGKIMRRLLLDVAERRPLGDVTTLADSTVVDMIAEKMKTMPSATDDA